MLGVVASSRLHVYVTCVQALAKHILRVQTVTIRNLFTSKSVKFISYIDDITLIVASKSLKRNVKILEREVIELYIN